MLGLSLPEDVIKEVEDAWKKIVNIVNESCGIHSLEAQFFPFAEDVSDFPEGEGEKCPPAGSYVRIIFLISISFS